MNVGKYAVVISSKVKETTEEQLNTSKSAFNMNFKFSFLTPNPLRTANCWGKKQASYK